MVALYVGLPNKQMQAAAKSYGRTTDWCAEENGASYFQSKL